MGNSIHLSSRSLTSSRPSSSAHTRYDSSHSITEHQQRQRCLQEGLVRDRDSQHVFADIYEVLEEIGRGGLCRIYKIRKRDFMVGGSSRPEMVRRRSSSLFNLRSHFSSSSNLSAHGSTESLPSMIAASSHKVHHHRYRESLYAGSPMLFALKVFNLKLIRGGTSKIDQLKNEVELLRTLDHRSIVKAYETFQCKDTKHLMLIMELCTGGDLYARMPYTEHQVAWVMKQCLNALRYMHDRNVIHRDIKMENIMFESHHPEAAVKVIDFGLSVEYSKSDSVLKERVGTLYSMAPETLQGSYTAQADLWSVGVVAYIMLSGGEKPFQGKIPKHVVAAVLRGQYSFDLPMWSDVTEDAKDFIRRLLIVRPEDRMTTQQALRHPFIAKSCRYPLGSTNNGADEALKQRVREGIVRYADRSDFCKLALNVIAKKSSADEIFELRKVFDDFDTENTGTITLNEFRHALAKFNYSDEDLFDIFQKLDVNKTSVINYTEFLASALEAQGKIEEHRLAEAFDLLDIDDSGFISREDLKRVLGEHTDEAYIDQLIAQADFKKDGRVSYEEFLQAFAEQHHDRVYNIYEESSGQAFSTHSSASADEVLRNSGIPLPKTMRNL